MFDVTKIDLKEVFKKYFGLEESDFQREGKMVITKCPFHGDSHPSLKIYTEKDSPDFYCFVCKAGGNAVNALVKGGVVDSEDKAVDKLMEDFNLRLPAYVDVATFAALKGLDADYLAGQGWKNEGDKLSIPYYDENMVLKARKIRTKYAGKNKYFYDDKVTNSDNTTYYGLNRLSTYTGDTIYFTEGETDQVTLAQAGYPAIGIPSTNAWKSTCSHLFTKFKRHVVVRDNDKAGSQLVNSIARDFPSTTYYVQLPGKTNDINNFWNYTVNKDVSKFKEFMDTTKLWPATPEAFKQGLIDGVYTNPYDLDLWELVVMQYKSDIEVKVFIEELAEAVPSVKKALLKDVAKEAAAKNEKHANVIDMNERYIYQEGNCYYKEVNKKGFSMPMKISNFVIKLHSVVNYDGDYSRYVVFTNEHNETSQPMTLDGTQLTNIGAFKALCVTKGGFSFTGNDRDLAEITLSLIDQARDMIKVDAISKVGHVGDTWIFGNAAIDKDGKITVMGDDNVLDIGGKKYLLTTDGVSDDATSLPTINVNSTGVDLKDIKRKLAYSVKGAYGTFATWSALGWAVSGWYSDMIFKQYNMYPLMFLFGKRNSGKSTLAANLMEFFGFDGMMSGKSAESTSKAALSKELGTHYSLPVWIDDYRNNSIGSQAKNSLLLNTYNRHGSTKGIPNTSKVRKENINGFVLLSGEDSPQDNALASRCIVIEVSSNKNDMVKFKEFQNLQVYFRELGVDFCVSSTSRDKQLELLKKITEIQAILTGRGIDTRLATNAAVFAAAFLLEFEDVLDKTDVENYLAWVSGGAVVNKNEIEDNHVVNVFWNEVAYLIEKGLVTKNDHYILRGGKYVSFRIDPVYVEWSRYNPSLSKQWSGTAIKNYIKTDSYFIEEERPVVNGMRSRRLKLDIERLKVYSFDLYEVLKNKMAQEAEEPQF